MFVFLFVCLLVAWFVCLFVCWLWLWLWLLLLWLWLWLWLCDFYPIIAVEEKDPPFRKI